MNKDPRIFRKDCRTRVVCPAWGGNSLRRMKPKVYAREENDGMKEKESSNLGSGPASSRLNSSANSRRERPRALLSQTLPRFRRQSERRWRRRAYRYGRLFGRSVVFMLIALRVRSGKGRVIEEPLRLPTSTPLPPSFTQPPFSKRR